MEEETLELFLQPLQLLLLFLMAPLLHILQHPVSLPLNLLLPMHQQQAILLFNNNHLLL